MADEGTPNWDAMIKHGVLTRSVSDVIRKRAESDLAETERIAKTPREPEEFLTWEEP